MIPRAWRRRFPILERLEDRVNPVVLVQSVAVTGTNPTPTDNDYTRINNAIQSAVAGEVIELQGTFNWTEPNAAASWALGSNGIAGDNDDYSILIPAGLNQVTLTAASLGAARIQGPGDLANFDLEGVFFFDGGVNQGWTISNLEIFDFDMAIGMFGDTNSSAFDNTTIINNRIRVPKDLNATVAPIDVSQNVAIHYAFGKNQKIQNNQIEIEGDGISDTPAGNYSFSIGMQSNSSASGVYDGLLISGNVITVTSAQSSDPAVIIGIWENGQDHGSNITVQGNSFTSTAPGNNPALNQQSAFRITSHSSATTTVAYLNNDVEGANIGFEWLAAQDFSGNLAVQIWGNTVLNSHIGVLVQSNGVANLFQNTLTMGGTGVSVTSGQLTGSGAVTHGAEQNFISNNATGIVLGAGATVPGGIFNNSLSNNTGFGLDNQSGGTVDASGNWWGSNTAAGVAAEVNGSVDYTPWLNTGTDRILGVPGFQGDFSFLNVGTGGAQTGLLGRIQEAIDLLVDGSLTGGSRTVFLTNGLYIESNTTVDKASTIRGQSRTGVILAPAAEDSNQDSSFGGVAQQGFIVSADQVTITTLTINGQANPLLTPGKNNFRNGVITPDDGNDRSTLVFTDLEVKNFYRRGVQITWSGNNNEISNSIFTQNSGAVAANATGVGVFGGSNAPTVVSRILGNTITSTQGTGIVANFGAWVNIQGNTITSTPTGMNLAALEGGSLIGGPTLAERNVINLIGVGNAVGIQLTFSDASPFFAGTITVQNNQILADGNDAGIWLFHLGGAPVQILANQLTSTGSFSSDVGEGTGIFLTDDAAFFGESQTSANNAVFEGNTINGFFRGIDISRVSGQAFNVTLTNNAIAGTDAAGSTGFRMTETPVSPSTDFLANIDGLTVTDHATGVQIDGVHNLSMLRTSVTNGGTGLTLSNLTGITTVTDLTVTGNVSGGSVNNVPQLDLTPTTGNTVDAITASGTSVQFTRNPQTTPVVNQALTLTNLTLLNLFGDGGSDSFSITPAATGGTLISVHGGPPAPPTLPGDNLLVQLAGTLNPMLQTTSSGSGIAGDWQFSNRQTVQFQQIESLNTINLIFFDQPTTVGPNTPFNIVVEIRDSANNAVVNYNGPVTLKIVSGPVLNPNFATVNAVNGVATFNGLTLPQVGTYTLSAEAQGVVTGTSGPIQVVDEQLVFTQIPTNVRSNKPSLQGFTPFTIRVALRDSNGVIDTTFNGAVTLRAVSGPGSLFGTTTVNAVNGVATFSTLYLRRTGDYVIQASSPGLDPILSPTVVVTANRLTLPGLPNVVGLAIPYSIIVRAVDSEGFVATNFNGVIRMEKVSGPGDLRGRLSENAVNGVAVFTNLGVSAFGQYSLRARTTQTNIPSLGVPPVTIFSNVSVITFLRAGTTARRRDGFPESTL